ncbi:protein of unknown function [Methanoculleus bourgensis]|uniref:HNH endonuclease n=1 Tax=Methanoculleus bourgensis TaxID=83986 RepID=A0A0X3BK05_9EURY|nr:protein of unknown function [Methanoculleus bourgensis]
MNSHWIWVKPIISSLAIVRLLARLKQGVQGYFEHEYFLCGKPQKKEFRAFAVHHVLNNPDPRCLEQPWPLVPLCHKCHGRT